MTSLRSYRVPTEPSARRYGRSQPRVAGPCAQRALPEVKDITKFKKRNPMCGSIECPPNPLPMACPNPVRQVITDMTPRPRRCPRARAKRTSLDQHALLFIRGKILFSLKPWLNQTLRFAQGILQDGCLQKRP